MLGVYTCFYQVGNWHNKAFQEIEEEEKKITVLSGHPFVPFLAWCPGFVPTLTNLCYFTVQILYLPAFSDFFVYNTEKIAGGRGSTPDSAGGAHDASWTPDSSQMWRSQPRTLRLAPSALIPDCDAQTMVTLYKGQFHPLT